jgi:hypothetical protein
MQSMVVEKVAFNSDFDTSRNYLCHDEKISDRMCSLAREQSPSTWNAAAEVAGSAFVFMFLSLSSSTYMSIPSRPHGWSEESVLLAL